MSKIREAIWAAPTGRGFPQAMNVRSLVTSYKEEEVTSAEYRHRAEYRIGLKVETKCLLTYGSSSIEKEKMIETARRSLIEEVFGEFRLPLYRALQEIKYGEPSDAEELINDVLVSMFGEFV